VEVAQRLTTKARGRLQAILAARSDHPFAHGLLGEVLSLLGEREAAAREYREAVQLNPRWLTPWLNWATLARAEKQPAVAAHIVEDGLKANPDSEELYMLLASTQSEQGQIDAAMNAYDAALRLNPRNVLAANNLAVLLVDRKGDQPSLQKAFALSRDFEKEAPHPLFLDTLGWVRFKMGQQEEAIRLMKHAVAKAPETSILNYHLGIAFFQSGKRDEARVHLSKALKSAEVFDGRQEAEQVLAQLKG